MMKSDCVCSFCTMVYALYPDLKMEASAAKIFRAHLKLEHGWMPGDMDEMV